MSHHSTDNEYATEPGVVAKFAATLVMSVVIGCVLLQVVDRYALHMSVNWTEELARFCMLAIAGVGGVLAATRRAHFRVGMLVELLPDMPQRIVTAIVLWVTSAYMIYVALSGYWYCRDIADSTSPMLSVSYAVPYSIVPFAAVLIAVASARLGWRALRQQGARN